MILYLHGLESSPNGHKANYLKRKFGAYAVDLDTSEAIASRNAALEKGVRWTHEASDIRRAFSTPMSRATAAIKDETRLIIGSSFGGAVLMNLIANGSWRGPSLFICPAVLKLTTHTTLPGGFPVIVLHGRQDDLIPISDSRRLIKTGGPGAMLWEIDDGHRMRRIVDTGILSTAINWLLTDDAWVAVNAN